MNSEFRPAIKGVKKVFIDKNSIIIDSLHAMISTHPNAFSFKFVKRSINFNEFLSEINRLKIDSGDNDIRSLFMKFDIEEKGIVDTERIQTWINSGKIVSKAAYDESIPPIKISLRDLLVKIGGRTTQNIEKCFTHIPKDRHIKLSLDEFKSCLLSGGMGKNSDEIRQLFVIVGNDPYFIDIDELRKVFPTTAHDLMEEVSAKSIIPATVRSRRVDRFIRETIRKSYADVRDEIESFDPDNTGYIGAEDLHKIIVKRCLPLTFQDFRFVLQQLKTNSVETKVDWKHFLTIYNPIKAPHILDTISTLKNLHLFSGEDDYFEQAAPDFPKRASTASVVIRPTKSFDAHVELKKLWTPLLKECHRFDPDRHGFVYRSQFISALERSNISKVSEINQLYLLIYQYFFFSQ